MLSNKGMPFHSKLRHQEEKQRDTFRGLGSLGRDNSIWERKQEAPRSGEATLGAGARSPGG